MTTTLAPEPCVGLTAVVIETVLGILVGALAGYYGGRLDSLLMRFTEAMIIIPQLFNCLVGDKIVISAIAKVYGQTVIVHFTKPAGNVFKFPPAGTLLVKKQNIGIVGLNNILICCDHKAISSSKCYRAYPDGIKGTEHE